MKLKNRFRLTKEERQIEKDILDGKYVYAGDEMRNKFTQAAQNKKSSRITITVNNDVIDYFRKLSVEEGIPYQTLIHSVLYKYTKKMDASRKAA